MKNRRNLAALGLLIITLIIYTGCNDNGGDGGELNTCFSTERPEPEPCFDPNEEGSTTFVTDKTVDEVISEQEGMPGFIGELDFEEIIKEDFFPGPATPEMLDCLSVYVQSELVINNEEDWDLFRDSCWFSQFDLSDVDFSSHTVLAVIQDSIGIETEIVAILEFNSNIVVIVRDNEFSEMPPSVHAGPFHMVSISKSNVPFDFIRVIEVAQ